MPSNDHPPSSCPSDGEVHVDVALSETDEGNDYIAGGASCAVGTLRFGRGQLPTSAST